MRFLGPGLDHCYIGVGPINIGQYLHHYKSDDPISNVLLALVDRVERGATPDTITGVSDRGEVTLQVTQKSTWDGGKYSCIN